MCGLWRREDLSEPGGPEPDGSDLDVLAERLGLAGTPQAILRFGYPP